MRQSRLLLKTGNLIRVTFKMLLLREQEIIKKANREMKKETQAELSSRNPEYRLSIPQNAPGVARVLIYAGAMPLSW
jgi:hypothetical protein